MSKINKEAEAKLKEILSKDLSSITKADIIFLRARSAYLSRKQKGIYKRLLRSDTKEEKVEIKVIPYKELQRQAKALGYPYVGISRADLEVAISTGVGAQDA